MAEINKSFIYSLANFEYQPLISLATPVYNTRPDLLRSFLESVLDQSYQNWELVLCDNGCDSYTSHILTAFANTYSRIKIVGLSDNYGPGRGLQVAVSNCIGDYIGIPDSDDLLDKYCLNTVVKYLNYYGQRSVNIIYTNELVTGAINVPIFKPKFNPYLLYFLHYIGHLTFYKTSLIKELGIKDYRGSYDYGLSLRASNCVPYDTIFHIPEFLYEYRLHGNNTSLHNVDTLRLGGKEALEEHLKAKMIFGTVYDDGSLYHVKFANGEDAKIDLDSLYDYPVFKPHLYSDIFGLQK